MTGPLRNDEADPESRVPPPAGSFDAFFSTSWPRLSRGLGTLASDYAMGQDAATEAFMITWNRWDDVCMYEHPYSWVYTTGLRILRRMEAKARALGILAEDPAAAMADLRAAAAVDDWVASNLDAVALLRQLPRRQAEAVLLIWIEGYTTKEAARLIGITDGAVKQHLHRAKRRLLVLLRNWRVPDMEKDSS